MTAAAARLCAAVALLVGLTLPGLGGLTATPAAASRAVLAGAATSSASPTAGQAGPSDSAAGEPTDDDEPVTGAPWIRIDQAPEYLQPGQEAIITFTLTAGDAPIPAGWSVLLTMQPRMLTTRSAIQAWRGASLEGSVGMEVTRVPIDAELAPGASRQVQVNVPADPARLADDPDQFGPRAVALVLVDDTIDVRQAITRSFLVWNPGLHLSNTPRYSVLVPVTSGRLDPQTGLARSTQLAETADQGRLAGLLDLAERPGVTLALDPSVLTAKPTEGDPAAPTLSEQDDQALQAWRERVRTVAARHELLGLGYADPDLLALADAGQQPLAQLADEIAAQIFDDTGVPVRRDIAYPVLGQADSETVDLVASLGRKAAIVLNDQTQQGSSQTSYSARSQVSAGADEVPTLVSDTQLSQALALTGQNLPDGGGNAVQRLRADTAVIALQAPSLQRTLLVDAPRGWTATGNGVLGLDVLGASWADPGTLNDLLAAEPQTRDDPRLSTAQRRQALDAQGVDEVSRQLDQAAELLSVVAEPRDRLADSRRGAAGLVSVTYRDSSGTTAEPPTAQEPSEDVDLWAQAIDQYAQTAEQLRTGIHVVPGATVTQVSRNVRLPVTVSNDTDDVVRVVLNVQPTSNRLVVTKDVEVVVPPRSSAVGHVPVRGVGNGDTSVRITVLTPGGLALGEPTVTQVQVRADWESFGTAAIGVVAFGLFAVGLIRSVRRGTRSSRAAEQFTVPSPPDKDSHP
ncbi:MAG: DUF6049 family protein [Actinomycetales bacterium]